MRTLELKKAVGPLHEYVSAGDFEPLVLTTKGKPVAALISIDATDEERLGLSTNPQFLDLISHSRKRLKYEGEEHFADWAQILLDQALLAEGGQLEDPAGFVKKLNGLVLANESNLRDTIAFPKNQAGIDPMSGAPSEVPERQLDELHIRVVPPKGQRE